MSIDDATLSNTKPPNRRPSRNSTWLTKEEAAEYLSCSLRLIDRLVQERRLPFTRIAKFVRISQDDLEAFAEAGRVEALAREAPSKRRPKRMENLPTAVRCRSTGLGRKKVIKRNQVPH
jgi:excisionase family DNA binding protein